MKDLLRVALVLALAFASTFFLFELTGLTSEARIREGLGRLSEIHAGWIVLAVLLLLVLDLFIAVPTMTTILLAGYLLGPWLGGAVSALGLMLLGAGGYAAGRVWGRRVLLRLFRDDARLAGIEAAYARNDLLTLFVCQALPILPELSCCLAGIARMAVPRFLFGYGMGVVPFAFIIAWAGSESTLAEPWPAIYTAIATSTALLLAWTVLRRGAKADPAPR